MAFVSSKTLRHLALGLAAALCLAAAANAQQASGNITGTAATGDTVVVEGVDTGFHRELNIKKDGKYNLRVVPAGEYIVTITRADGTTSVSRTVVRVGSTARVR